MRDAARDVGEEESVIVVVVGVTVNVDNVVSVSVSASATAGGLSDESRAREGSSAGRCRSRNTGCEQP